MLSEQGKQPHHPDLPIVNIGISRVDHWIATGARLLIERAEFPLESSRISWGDPLQYRAYLDAQTCGLKNPSESQVKALLTVEERHSAQILEGIAQRSINIGIVEPEAAEELPTGVYKVAHIFTPGLSRSSTIPEVLLASYEVSPEVVNAQQLRGITNLTDRIVAKLTRASRLVLDEANQLKSKRTTQ